MRCHLFSSHTSSMFVSEPIDIPIDVRTELPVTASLQSALLAKRLTSFSRSLRSTNPLLLNTTFGSISSYDTDDISAVSSWSDQCCGSSSCSSCCITPVSSVDESSHPLAFHDEVPELEYTGTARAKKVHKRKSQSLRKAYSTIVNTVMKLTKRHITPVAEISTTLTISNIPLEPQQKFHDVQMQTYKTVFSTLPVVEKRPIAVRPETSTKPREVRINPDFLKFYAIDFSCRCRNYLRLTDQELDLYQQEFVESGYESIDVFLDDYIVDSYESSCDPEVSRFRQSLKVGLMSRQKLWSGVILPPRQDVMKRQQTYFPTTKGASLVSQRGKFLPWLNLNDFDSLGKTTIPPYGQLASGVQFTVKGWCNSRFASVN